jgi:hypothetical protein
LAPVVSIDGDVSHAADEASLAVDSSAEHVVGPGGEIQDPSRLSLLVVDDHGGVVLGHGELERVPLAVVESLKHFLSTIQTPDKPEATGLDPTKAIKA